MGDMENNHNYLEVAGEENNLVDVYMNIAGEPSNDPDPGESSSPSAQEEEEEDEDEEEEEDAMVVEDQPPMRVELPPDEIIEAVDLENVGNIEIIENVENIANVVEVQAINEDNAAEMINNNEDSTASSSATSSSVPESEEEKPRKKRKLEVEEKAKSLTQESDEPDEGRSCPICMEEWTNSGEHRLCSLACGHLFGHKCVLRWLKQECTAQNRRCPHCNTKAHIKDIRMIYTTNLSAVDTIELDRLKNELQTVVARNKSMESEISKSQLRYKIAQDRIKELNQKIADLETERRDIKMVMRERGSGDLRKFHLDKTFDIAKDGCCRVLDYNSWYGYLTVSQKSTNMIFPGYGVKKIDTHKYEQMQFTLLHSQAIRDMAFHQTQQSLLLTVSFDKTAKLMDIHNNQVLHGFPVESQVWSCCWTGDNSNIFVVGTQKGLITQFDIRQTAGALDTIDSPGDRSPIVSLATVPPASSNGVARGGFLASHLNSCYAYEMRNNIYVAKQMLHEGPFTCVRYNTQNHHALISCRPNSTNPQARHTVFSIEKATDNTVVCNTVHTFTAGNTQNLLSRPCHINFTDETFVAAHHESNKSLPIWSVSTGKEMQNIPVSAPVVDLCSFRLQNSVVLGALSGNKLRLYNCEQP